MEERRNESGGGTHQKDQVRTVQRFHARVEMLPDSKGTVDYCGRALQRRDELLREQSHVVQRRRQQKRRK